MAERIRGPRAIVGIRARTVQVATASWEADWRRYFQGFARRYKAEAFRKGAGGPFHVKQGAGSSWWSGETAVMRELLNQQYASMTETVWTDVVSAQVGRKIDFDLSARGMERILDRVGTRITAMSETSQRIIADYTNRVLSGDLPGVPATADALERGLDRLLRSWGESGGRAHIIALTESGNAYNLAATEGYRESGLVENVQVYDGPECGWTEHDDPDLADGSIRTLEEAEDYPLSHPHCQRAFGPVVLTEEDAQEAGLQAGEQVEDQPPLDLADDQAYDDYARDAYSDWQGVVDPDAVSAAEVYTGGSYADINGFLRGTVKEADISYFDSKQELMEVVRNIDRAMIPARDTIITTRTVWDDAYRAVLEEANIAVSPVIRDRLEALRTLLPGKVLQDPGFFSTSMAQEVPANAARAVSLRITVPKGTPVAPVRQVSVFQHEKELLLGRGVRYVVTKAEMGRGVNGVTLELEVTVLP